jgi:hypothetical protein
MSIKYSTVTDSLGFAVAGAARPHAPGETTEAPTFADHLARATFFAALVVCGAGAGVTTTCVLQAKLALRAAAAASARQPRAAITIPVAFAPATASASPPPPALVAHSAPATARVRPTALTKPKPRATTHGRRPPTEKVPAAQVPTHDEEQGAADALARALLETAL